jgi:hypothetical protein
MESRHDSENAERILYNMRPKELVSWVVSAGAMAPKNSRTTSETEWRICLLELSDRFPELEV